MGADRWIHKLLFKAGFDCRNHRPYRCSHSAGPRVWSLSPGLITHRVEPLHEAKLVLLRQVDYCFTDFACVSNKVEHISGQIKAESIIISNDTPSHPQTLSAVSQQFTIQSVRSFTSDQIMTIDLSTRPCMRSSFVRDYLVFVVVGEHSLQGDFNRFISRALNAAVWENARVILASWRHTYIWSKLKARSGRQTPELFHMQMSRLSILCACRFEELEYADAASYMDNGRVAFTGDATQMRAYLKQLGAPVMNLSASSLPWVSFHRRHQATMGSIRPDRRPSHHQLIRYFGLRLDLEQLCYHVPIRMARSWQARFQLGTWTARFLISVSQQILCFPKYKHNCVSFVCLFVAGHASLGLFMVWGTSAQTGCSTDLNVCRNHTFILTCQKVCIFCFPYLPAHTWIWPIKYHGR